MIKIYDQNMLEVDFKPNSIPQNQLIR